MNITQKQLGLLHHTLGLTPDRREPFRNHFMASEGHHDQPDLEALEALGLMARGRTPTFCDADDVLFRVTDAGKALALDFLPQPPKYSRYEQYRRSECCESFAEWLGIEVPRIESNYRHGRDHLCRYVRRDYDGWTLAGEWKSTKKDAKASYKAALAAHRGSAVPA